jgi:hypothetical protein
MKCDAAQENILLVTYGELPDDRLAALEQHLAECEACNRELKALLAMHELLAIRPSPEPSPNLLTQSRMRLDEELDLMPAHGFVTRLRSHMYAWLGHVQSAPALVTLLVGVGFLGGNFARRYEEAKQPKPPAPLAVMSDPANATIANISGVTQTPNSEIVQVSYNRLVPETVQGTLDDPQIRQLLLLGTKAATNNGVRTDSVALLADECRAGHECADGPDGTGIRNGLLASLRHDRNPAVRLKALEGLQPYVAQDESVRDALLEALMHDSNADVRIRAISMLEPVESDSSVRQVMRTVSTSDDNPYIRNVSTHALAGTADIQ